MPMYACTYGWMPSGEGRKKKTAKKGLCAGLPNICTIARREWPCCAGCFQSNQTHYCCRRIGIRIIANARNATRANGRPSAKNEIAKTSTTTTDTPRRGHATALWPLLYQKCPGEIVRLLYTTAVAQGWNVSIRLLLPSTAHGDNNVQCFACPALPPRPFLFPFLKIPQLYCTAMCLARIC